MTESQSGDAGVVRVDVALAPLQVPKASDVLAEELRELILRGDYPEGTALPPERELVTQTGMSRTTVREAMRILEVQGLVSVRTGRAGGAFARRPGRDSIANSVNLLIRGQQIRIPALLETREAIEPSCAQLAARYRTDADLARIEKAQEAMSAEEGTIAEFLRANIDWHVAVALASHNELLAGFMTALSDTIYTATDNHGFLDQEVRRATIHAHKVITSAIRDRDPDAALRRMSRHVHAYAASILEVEEREAVDVEEV
ncbi:FCD domain-containing protein [Actinomadura sp. LD22]|uniref:FCD domain-containing protein n=1 Tax=Actinomadura physcomitrii TaxID=2650748 RepID=A0A6I4M7I9_9ACTN|nr:FadR/GntR family transcriptional regulator [Actinomadura physcomitrii]MWA01592.1 FCD domain-containing protein [Actinomadura physcomitrii]